MPFEITFDTPQSMNADFEAEEPMLAEFLLQGGGGGGGSGLTDEIKQALLTIAEKVAYIDEHGQTYYQALYDALYPAATMFTVTNTLTGCTNSNVSATVAEGSSYSGTITAVSGYSLTGATVSVTMGGVDITASAYNNGTISIASVTGNIAITISAVAVVLSSISAVFTQGQTVVYDTDSLDSLKSMLVVTATYSDSSTQTVPSTDYTLSGTLTAGTSTITVSYGGKTDTFTVTVTQAEPYIYFDYIQGDGTAFIDTGLAGNVYSASDYEHEIKFAVEASVAANKGVYGCRNNGGYTNSRTVWTNELNINVAYCGSRTGYVLTALLDDAVIVKTTKDKKVLFNGNEVLDASSGSSINFGKTCGIPLFAEANAVKYGSDYTAYSDAYICTGGRCKVYWFKVWDSNGDLVADMRPARRASDNVVGMYDVVRDLFFTNAGSAGSFTLGND